MSGALLVAEGLSVALGNKAILHDISFSVARGEVLSLIGPNGAGKSTLIRAIAGLVSPSHGALYFNGEDLRRTGARQRARWMSYVPQAHGFDAPYTAFELVLMARFVHFRGIAGPGRHDRDVAAQALARLGMAPFADRMLSTLSGGERQKVLIAAALAQEAPMLLLDEPLTFLDYRHQAEIVALLQELRAAQEHTLIWVGHDLNQNLGASDRVLALREGRVICHDRPEQIARADRLAEIYGIPFDLVAVPGQDLPVVHPRAAQAARRT